MTDLDPDRDGIDKALARFLDGEPEPEDGELLTQAMRADDRFAREVVRLLVVDDLLRQDALSDDAAFIEEEEEGDPDVTDIIGETIEKEEET